MDLNGKNLVFVAGFGGIGFEACKQLMAKNLANLFILEVRENGEALQNLQQMNKNTKVYFIKCDVADKASIKNAVNSVIKNVPCIDVLVNGAGIMADRKIELTINVNLIGLINMTMELLPYMDKSQKGRGGVIINIASTLGLVPCPPLAVYSASKFGVVGFTRSLADPYYYNRSGVALSALCPGYTKTTMTADHVTTKPDTFEFAQPLTDELFSGPGQPASKAGEHLVEIIEKAQNDTLWISEISTLRLLDPELLFKF